MIVSAAVRIYDKKQNKEVTLPVHRHCDAFYILKELGYSQKDFISTQKDQGFLDEKGNFYDRVSAYEHVWLHSQLPIKDYEPRELFSEDLW